MKISTASQRLNDRSDKTFAKELWPNLRNVGDTVTVRFLEQGEDLKVHYMHEYTRGKRFMYVMCLDQDEHGDSLGAPCPGCEGGYKRTIKGAVNVILRNAPQLRRGDDGRAVKDPSGRYVVEGTKDEVVTWMQGIQTFEDLASKDSKYRGLSSRDFSITKKAKGFSVDPIIMEEDGNTGPMTDEDHALAAEKYNLNEVYFEVPSYDEAAATLSGGQAPSGGGVTEADVQQTQAQGSPWGRGSSDASRANRFLNN